MNDDALDPGEAFAHMAAERDDALRTQPQGDRPDYVAPDLELFRETGQSTDRALADRFFRNYRHLFCNGDGLLHVFHKDRSMWSAENVPEQVFAYCVHLSDQYHEELAAVLQDMAAARAGGEGNLDQLTQRRDAILKMIVHCEKASTIGNVTRMLVAKLKTLTAGRPQSMNFDPEVLACSNGVVDLRTGQLRWATREDYLTRNTGCVYDAEADDGWWREVILGIAGGNERIAEFMQVWAGYCATGYTKEHCMAILWGMGRNGKNLYVDSVAAALGRYAKALPGSFLEAMGEKTIDNNMLYALADLHGIRLAYASETGEKGKLKESWVKGQTGDRIITARSPYSPFFEFQLTHKLIVGTNHKPEITGTDDGVWERIRMVAFRVRFGTQAEVDAGVAQGVKNQDLLTLSTSEPGRRAVLKWIVDGARKYLANGLRRYTPVEILAETQMYRREQDVLGQFLQDATEWINPVEVDRVMSLEAQPGNRQFQQMTLDDRLRFEKLEMWRIYAIWCDEHGHKPMSATMFSRRIGSAQRFWQDEIGEEKVMRPLESFKSNNTWFYRYVRISEYGRVLRVKAQAQIDMLARRTAKPDDND